MHVICVCVARSDVTDVLGFPLTEFGEMEQRETARGTTVRYKVATFYNIIDNNTMTVQCWSNDEVSYMKEQSYT